MAQYNINVGVNAYQAARGIAQIRTNLNQLNNSANRSRNILSNLFITPLIGIYTLQAGLINTVGTLAIFSRSMATVRAITGGTQGQIASLEQEFTRLGRTTRFTASQAAQAGVFLARAGFEADTIRDVSEATLELALATGVDTAKAADIATNVLTAFGQEIEQLPGVFDQLTFVVSRTNTDLLALSEALKFIAPSAQSANVPLNQIIALLGVLAQSGLRGSIAGTSLRRVISGLANETPTVAKKLATLGLTFEDINLDGGDLIGVFELLQKRGVDLGDAFALFGVRGGPGFEALRRHLPEVIRLAKETENVSGFTSELARIMGDNLFDALVRVGSAMESIILALGKIGAEGALTKFLDGLTARLRAIAAEVGVLADIIQSVFALLAITFGAFLARNLIPAIALLSGLAPTVTALISTLYALGTALTAIFTGAAFIGLSIFTTSLFALATTVLALFKRFIIIGTALAVGFGDEIKILGSVITTLSDFIISLGLIIANAFLPANSQVSSFRELLSGIGDSLINLVSSEPFLHGLVSTVDVLIRTILAAGEAFRSVFSNDGIFGDVSESAGNSLRRTLIERELAVLQIQDSLFRSRIPGESEQDIHARRERIFGLQVELAEIDAALREQSEGVGFEAAANRIAELINTPFITFEEVSQAALDRARDRIITFTEDQRRLAAEPTPERLPLTDAIIPETEEQVQERAFLLYLENQRKEFMLLGLNNRERKIRNELLEAENALEFELNTSQEARLRNLIVENQVANSLAEFRQTAAEDLEILRLTTEERETQTAVLEFQRDLYRNLTEAEQAEVESIIVLNQQLALQAGILDELRYPAIENRKNVAALNTLYTKGAISRRVYNEEILKEYTSLLELRDLQNKIPAESSFANIFGIDATNEVIRGVKLGVLDFNATVQNTLSLIRNATVNVFKNMEDALVNFVFTGKIEFASLVNSILADLVRLSIRQTITGPLFGAITTAFAAPTGAGYTFGIASGGLVRGPGSGTSDSINARISNGEFVVNAASTRAYLPILQAINKFGGNTFSSKNNDNGVSIEIIDQRSTNAPPVEIENRGRQPDGRVAIRATIRDTTKDLINNGELDKNMVNRYGLRPLI